MSIQTPTGDTASTDSETTTTTGTVQATIGSNALRCDIETILSGNREIAAFAYKQEPFYATRLKTALRDHFGWDVGEETIRSHVEAIGGKTLRAYARPHPPSATRDPVTE